MPGIVVWSTGTGATSSAGTPSTPDIPSTPSRRSGTVLTYDPVGEGERNLDRKDGTRQHDRTVDPPEMGRRMGGLMMTDLMQAVSYLARPSPTPTPGAWQPSATRWAHSFWAIARAVETRLNSCVLAGGGNLDGPGGYWDSSSKKMCPGDSVPVADVSWRPRRGAVRSTCRARRHPRHQRYGGRRGLHSANGVDVLRRFSVERVVALHGSEQNVFDVVWIEGAGHRPHSAHAPRGAMAREALLEFPR